MKPGWSVEEGAWLEVPTNAFLGPTDEPWPEQILCQSIEDEKHYKFIKDRDQIEPEEWRETGLVFGGTFSTALWEHFTDYLPAGQWIASTDDVEVLDEVLRRIHAGR